MQPKHGVCMMKGMSMGKRLDRAGMSSEQLHMSLTLEDEANIKALAHYDRKPYSQFLRDLAKNKRESLVKEGKRPPRKPRVNGDREWTGPRNDGAKRVYRHIRVTSEEKEEVIALAQYLEIPYSQMLVELADARRRALLDEGKRPPAKPPEPELRLDAQKK